MKPIRYIPVIATLIVLWLGAQPAMAQERRPQPHRQVEKAVADSDSIAAFNMQAVEDELDRADSLQAGDAKGKKKRHKRNWATWRPETKRAMWLALVLPGAGQIYNRKYWKLPIIYGGFVGCAYALRWNNMMYRDYSQAYLDIMDDDPNTHSYDQFLHLGSQVDESNLERWQKLFKNRKDRYRRWRDLSFFVMIGVYAISVIDAYVDASLSEFDISPDLSMHIQPTVIGGSNSGTLVGNPWRSTGVGLQCSFQF